MSTQTIPQLESHVRDRVGSRYAARARAEGKLPAVMYGHGLDPVAISIDRKQIRDLLEDNTHLVEIQLDGKTQPCLIKDVQWDHMGIEIIHLDLTRVDLTEEVEVEIVVALVGEPAALQTPGAILDHPMTEIKVACRADQIPDSLQHSIESLEIGDSVTVGELTLPAGVKAVSDADAVICSIQVVQVQEEEEAEVEAAGEEPEVIGRKEEEEAEAKEKE